MLRKALAFVIALASCSSDGPLPLFIVGPLAPPTPASSTCVFQADLNGPFLLKGLMDSKLTTEYSAVLLLGNTSLVQAPRRIDVEALLTVDTATIIDTESDGTTELDRFTEDLGGFVEPPSGGSPGLGTVAVKLVSSRALRQSRGHAHPRPREGRRPAVRRDAHGVGLRDVPDRRVRGVPRDVPRERVRRRT